MADWRDWLLRAKKFGENALNSVDEHQQEMSEPNMAVKQAAVNEVAPGAQMAPPMIAPPAQLAPYERVNPGYSPGEADKMIQSRVARSQSAGPRY